MCREGDMCDLHIKFDTAKKLAKQLSSEVINAFSLLVLLAKPNCSYDQQATVVLC